ncbi:MAG: S41 family peptidase [Acidobacteriota bacterium]
MSRRPILVRLAAVTALVAIPAALAAARPHGGLVRHPDVSAEAIVFAYANDLWLVPRDGGIAVPLASPAGPELMPRFSPDGETIAFVGNYDGNDDIYTVPAQGGVPHRVTHHPAFEMLCDWTPDGEGLLFSFNGLAPMRRILELYTVDADGGLPRKLPVPYGACGAISPDGRWLAYTPHTRDNRTWKRYRGGMATDIWLFDLDNLTARRVTDWEGTDTQPMWAGGKLYYLSDAGPEHRWNVFEFDPQTNERRQLTTFEEFDTRHAAMGPGPDGRGEIVLQNGSDLYLLGLPDATLRRVEITIPGAIPTLRPQLVDASRNILSWDLSPSGKRVLVSARGDVFTLPAEHGSPRNLTRTAGAAERDPAWSPDGKSIAFFSDRTGEYELYVAAADGRSEARRLTTDGAVFRHSPIWSPDSRRIAFADKTGTIFVHDLDSGKTRRVDQDPVPATQPNLWASWSPDSRWLAYARTTDDGFQAAVYVWGADDGAVHQVTSGMFNDATPVFGRKGKFLFFVSGREFRPTYSDLDTTWIYAGTRVLIAAPLRPDVESPFLPKSDEEKVADESKKKEEGKDDAGKDRKKKKKKNKENGTDEKSDDGKKKVKPVEIAFDGFEARALRIPVDAGRFGALAVNDKNQLIYARLPVMDGDAKPAIKLFDLDDEKREEKTVFEGSGAFTLSADGKKLLALSNGKAMILDAKPGAKPKPVSTDGMLVEVDPRVEWRQVFNDAWRFVRDYFYDPHMHGVDWPGMREHYGAMIDECVTRDDVSQVIREMIAELNVGHAYYFGPPTEREPRIPVGLLGADYELHDGAYRFARIYRGGEYDLDARGPLGQPGIDVHEGDYLLAVDGQPVDPTQDPWAAFIGRSGRSIVITVSDKPTLDDSARDVVVEPLGSEAPLRYRAWIEKNRRYVAEKTGGRVGYIHVPDTGVNGQNELVRQYFGQIHKAGLIIDERWNGGGQIPTRFIELLNRPITNYWARRDGRDWPWPPDAHHGPKVMLINGLAGSGGDAFPAYFRQAGLGKLVGTRTWGGLVGISGGPRLIDGHVVTIPSFAFYEKDGTWGIEGHGVDPDIEVIDDPAKMVDGSDPQLDAAIAEVLAEIERHPYVPPKRPEYPDRSGMGIAPEDR